MTYEELLINIELNGYKNVLPNVGKKCPDNGYWFIVCDDGDCHLFDENGIEDDISKVNEIYEDIIPKDIKKIIIPNSVTSIRNWAFYNCSRLTSVMIPASVTNIGAYAFEGCSKLTSVVIPDSVTNIENGAFSDCSKLKSITIPNSVTSIGASAFEECDDLTSVMIGNNATSIGWAAFWGCSHLKSLIFKGKSFDQVKSMEYYPFGIEDESVIKCN